MYEFYFGELSEILDNEEKYLLFVKRLLPRWANGIPDSEYLAINNVLAKIKVDKENPPVLVETGSGASSLVLLYFAIKHGGTLYSWDTNGSKAAFLRGVANDTICKSFGVNLHKHWKFIEFVSTDKYLGLPVLEEKGESVDFCFLDSLHTLNNVLLELELLLPVMKDNSFIAIDDANYTNRYINIDYINIFRKKLGLPAVKDEEGNKCREYYIEVDEFLRNKIKAVQKIDDSYKSNFINDIFFSYYSTDKEVMGKVGMEKTGNLNHRFDAWYIQKHEPQNYLG